MKDPSIDIRTAYTAQLSTLSYNGEAVPFYDKEPLELTPDNYVVLTNLSTSPDNTDQTWSGSAQVTLDIVTKINLAIDRTACDTIANQICGTLFPTPDTAPWGTYDFHITFLDASSPGYIKGQKGSVHIIRKILTINHRVNQL